MKIIFNGTRGSVPSCGIEYVKYGGDTTCVQIITDEGLRVLVDAGTGIRNINDFKNGEEIIMCITHSHWDHLQGLPFFGQIYNPEAVFHCYMGEDTFDNIKNDLYKQMSGTTFPVSFETLPSFFKFNKVVGKKVIDENLSIEVFANAHPGGATSFKFINHDKVLTFITDNEIETLKKQNRYDDFVKFCKGSTMIVHDGQYSKEEYGSKQGWGHSSIDQVVDLCLTCKPNVGIFTHHDPTHSDLFIEKMEIYGQKLVEQSGVKMLFFGAKQNDIIEI